MKKILSLVLVLVFSTIMIGSATASALTDAVSRGDIDQHMTSGNGCLECAELLLKNGAGVNIKAKNGKTAMNLAMENGHEEVAEMLREAKEKR